MALALAVAVALVVAVAVALVVAVALAVAVAVAVALVVALVVAPTQMAGATGSHAKVIKVSTAKVPDVGTVLTTASGLTLYRFIEDPLTTIPGPPSGGAGF